MEDHTIVSYISRQMDGYLNHTSSLFLPITQGLYVRRTEVEPIKDVMADNPINTAMTKPYDTMWSCSLLKLLILRCVSLLNQLAKKSRTWSTYVKKSGARLAMTEG